MIRVGTILTHGKSGTKVKVIDIDGNNDVITLRLMVGSHNVTNKRSLEHIKLLITQGKLTVVYKTKTKQKFSMTPVKFVVKPEVINDSNEYRGYSNECRG
jgi:desulfoferrodoxin (superoxide reductase-like protein)